MSDWSWLEIVAALLGLAFAAYVVIAIEWQQRQMSALISMAEIIGHRLGKLEEIARTTEQIERHTARAAEPLYEQDQRERDPYL